MPPPQAKQPDDAARRQVINWIDATWKSEARRNDGDPGPVLARRLSNAEYNYTIQDLTGVTPSSAATEPSVVSGSAISVAIGPEAIKAQLCEHRGSVSRAARSYCRS